jgi:hypothetical protein
VSVTARAVLHDARFVTFSMGCVLANMVCVMLGSTDNPPELDNFIALQNDVSPPPSHVKRRPPYSPPHGRGENVRSCVHGKRSQGNEADRRSRPTPPRPQVFFYGLLSEVALSLLALGPRGVAASRWRLLDCAVVAGNLVGAGLRDPGAATVVRALRLLRLFRLASFVRPMRVILETLLLSLPTLVNILVLVLIWSDRPRPPRPLRPRRRWY